MKALHYLSDFTQEKSTSYQKMYNFSKEIMQLITETNNYPIIEDFEEYKIFVMILPIYNPILQHITLIECDIVIGETEVFVITQQEYSHISNIIHTIQKKKNKGPTTYNLLLELCRYTLSHIITLEKVIEQIKMNTIEEKGYTEETINNIMKLKLTIGMFRSTITPLSDVILHIFETIDYTKINEKNESNKNQIDYLIKQIQSQSNFLYDNISIVADTSNAIQNINANNIMKTLTIISSIFIPLSFVTGLFGMNFVDLPINNTVFYYGTIITMCFIGFLQLYVFKKRKRF